MSYSHYDFLRMACIKTVELQFASEHLAHKFRLQVYRFRKQLRRNGNDIFGSVEISVKGPVVRAGISGFDFQNTRLANGQTLEEMFKDTDKEIEQRSEKLMEGIELPEPTKQAKPKHKKEAQEALAKLGYFTEDD